MWSCDQIEGCSWFKFNNLGLALDMALKFYTNVAKRVRTKSQKVLGAYSNICRSYRGKLVGAPFCPQS